jgi:hypothetical protein
MMPRWFEGRLQCACGWTGRQVTVKQFKQFKVAGSKKKWPICPRCGKHKTQEGKSCMTRRAVHGPCQQWHLPNTACPPTFRHDGLRLSGH